MLIRPHLLAVSVQFLASLEVLTLADALCLAAVRCSNLVVRIFAIYDKPGILILTYNSDCDARLLKLMHPYLVEALRFLVAGSSSGWFGLWCPAHCSASLPLLGSVFCAGFGFGVISCLLWIFHPPRASFAPAWNHPWTSPATPQPSQPPSSRLSAYLHEFPRHPGQ